MLNNPLPNKDFKNGTFLKMDLILNSAAIMQIPKPLNVIMSLHHEEGREDEEELEGCDGIDDDEYEGEC